MIPYTFIARTPLDSVVSSICPKGDHGYVPAVEVMIDTLKECFPPVVRYFFCVSRALVSIHRAPSKNRPRAVLAPAKRWGAT